MKPAPETRWQRALRQVKAEPLPATSWQLFAELARRNPDLAGVLEALADINACGTNYREVWNTCLADNFMDEAMSLYQLLEEHKDES